jgi:hypothetical protein
MYIVENLKTKISSTCDVLVCGGGIAGISAALAAARTGKKVVLLDKGYMLGGLATAGLVTIYLPLCDGMGRQVSFGIAEELLRLSITHGAEDKYPANWLDGVGTRTEKDRRFEVQYNPQLFAVLAEKLLLSAGVEILYGTYAVGVCKEDERITHVIAENKSGRAAYAVGSVVDATGDCDIAHMAGAPTVNFKQGNVLAGWYYSHGQDGYKLNMVGASDIPDEDKKAGHTRQYLCDRRFTGLDGKELSEQVCMQHNAMYENLMKKRENDPTLVPVTIATIPQIRMTRRIAGEYELGYDEQHTYIADSIGMVSNWKKRGPVWEVPFGTLYNKAVKNLICAGRCTSVTETLWDVMRVIPCCAVTGQAAGTAAAMTTDLTTLPIAELQDALRAAGVVLHEKDL